MARYIKWFNEKTYALAPGQVTALTIASISHLYFESIHPFEDGNGRIGRAITHKGFIS